MSVTIQVLKERATIDGYRWTGADPSLVELLNAMLDQYGPSGADPNPDLTAAKVAAEELGGEIIDAGEPPEYVEGRVY